MRALARTVTAHTFISGAAPGAAGSGQGAQARRCRMGVMDLIRRLSRDQQEALRAIDRDEQNAIEVENLEADHIAAEEAYLRRKDRLVGRDVPERYQEIDAARAVLAQVVRARQERFEAMRLRVLAGGAEKRTSPAQLALLPGT